MPAGHADADDGDAGARPGLGLGEAAPANHRDAKRLEVVGGDAGEEQARLAPGLGGDAVHLDAADGATAVERHQVRRAGGLDAGQRLQAPDHVLDSADLGVVALVGAARHEHPHRRDRRRVEAEVGVLQVEEAAGEECRPDQQHDRQRHFADDQRVAGPVARAALAGAAALAQGRHEVALRHVRSRRQAEDESGEHADGDRVDQRQVVETKIDEIRHVVGRDPGSQQPGADVGQRDAERRRDGAEQHALGEQLADDAAAPGAEGGPHRHLAGPSGGPGQQQVGDVGAGDEQHEGDRAHRRQGHGAHVARDVVRGERLGAHPPAGVGRMLGGEPGGNRLQLVAALVERPPGSEPSEHLEIAALAGGALRHRGQRNPRVLQERELDPRRQHADHRVGQRVHGDRPADDRGVAVVAAPPQLVAEHHDAGGSRPIVIGGEVAAERRGDAQHREQAPVDRRAEHALGLVSVRKSQAASLHPDQRLEGAGLGLVVRQVRERYAASAAALGPRRRHDRELAGLGKRQRVQQQPADHAEHRGVGADAERQADHRQPGGQRRLPQRPGRQSDVVEESVHGQRIRAARVPGSKHPDATLRVPGLGARGSGDYDKGRQSLPALGWTSRRRDRSDPEPRDPRPRDPPRTAA